MRSVPALPVCAMLGCFSLSGLLPAQNTVGLLQYDEANSYQGYTLITPIGQEYVYLLNNCGQIVHEWPDTLLQPGNGIRLMPDGGIQRCAIGPNAQSSMFAGGGGQYVQRKDWDNTITWEWEYCNNSVRMHHDACLLPNGNTLIIAWENKTALEAWQEGRDTVGYGYNEVWPDHIIEVEPTGFSTGNIVWEWHVWDHLVQDFNPLADNFGVVHDHPELVNINVNFPAVPDWNHINGIEYNPVLDQIVLSVPKFDELWVINHSTTTAEAAGHTGGNSGRGGDLLYRWGSPMTYDHGTLADRQMRFNHGTAWVAPDALPGDPDFGRIIVFNNRFGNTYSSVDIIDTPVDANGNYTYVQDSAYAPALPSWRYTAPTPTDFFSGGLSNAQLLPNRNVQICSGQQGWIFEVDSVGTIVWQYRNPIFSGVPIAQGSTPPAFGNALFQAFRYGADHPGLLGRVLDPIGYIELDPDTTVCNLPMAVEAEVATGVVLQGNLVSERLVVAGLDRATDYSVIDGSGRVVLAGRLSAVQDEIDVRRLSPGVFVLQLHGAAIPGQRFAVVR